MAEGQRSRRIRLDHRRRGARRRFTICCRIEGIIPALESSHALAYAAEARADDGARTRSCWSTSPGRGDKDMHTVAERVKKSGLQFVNPAQRPSWRLGTFRAARPSSSDRGIRRESHRRFTAARRRPHGADSLHHRRRSVARARRCRSMHALVEARCRRHRARRAVLRSDGRRPGDPARVASARWRKVSASRDVLGDRRRVSH